jgi:hypothetical protein
MTELTYLQKRLALKNGQIQSTDSPRAVKSEDPAPGGGKEAKKGKPRLAPPTTPKGLPGKYKKKIKSANKKRAKQNRAYTKVKKKFLVDHPHCQAQLEGCTGQSTDLHHIGGRTGDNLLKVDDFAALCRNCHDIIHKKISAQQAKKIGMKK